MFHINNFGISICHFAMDEQKMKCYDYQSEQNWITFLSSLNVTFHFKDQVVISCQHFLEVNKLGLDCLKFLSIKFFSFFKGFIFFVEVDFHSTVITINVLINYHHCLYLVLLSIRCLVNTSKLCNSVIIIVIFFCSVSSIFMLLMVCNKILLEFY